MTLNYQAQRKSQNSCFVSGVRAGISSVWKSLELDQKGSTVHLLHTVYSLLSSNPYKEHCSRGLNRGRIVGMAISKCTDV